MFIALKNLLYIGNKLSKHGVTPTTIEVLGPLLEREGFVVSYASSQRNIYFRMIDMLWSIFQNRKVDGVLIDTYSTTNFWYAFATSQLCRLLQLKYIPILRGGDLPNRLKKNPLFCNLIFKNAYRNIIPSRYLYNSFNDFGFVNLVFIPNSIELNNYFFNIRKSCAPKILWVRSFAEIYNPLMAIEVFYKIKQQYPEATLCMVGPDKDGSLFRTQQRAKELGLEVLFTGGLSKKEWISLSKEYAIFINTTHFDNMPVSVMEAMSLGLAVVSTNVGGIPFLLEDRKDALRVPDNDVDAMVSAIGELIKNPDLFVHLVNNARHKSESFDWKSVKHKWIAILK
jgi:glycosyltransferase involved in cell wall biosynthesis